MAILHILTKVLELILMVNAVVADTFGVHQSPEDELQTLMRIGVEGLGEAMYTLGQHSVVALLVQAHPISWLLSFLLGASVAFSCRVVKFRAAASVRTVSSHLRIGAFRPACHLFAACSRPFISLSALHSRMLRYCAFTIARPC